MNQPRSKTNSSRWKDFCILALAILIIVLLLADDPLSSHGKHPVVSTMNDMRCLMTGLESYVVDNHSYPTPVSRVQGKDEAILKQTRGQHFLTIPNVLTTPVGYIPSGCLRDRFLGKRKMRLRVHGSWLAQDWETSELNIAYFVDEEFGYMIFSPGPDGEYDIQTPHTFLRDIADGKADTVNLIYDPTNGTISYGDIVRTQRGYERQSY